MRSTSFKLLLAFGFLLFLTACGRQLEMDKPTGSGYHYTNSDYRFSLNLPTEFVYYQTQRKDLANYRDLEFFIPTSDRSYIQEVEGYAKPLVVRIYDKGAYADLEQDAKDDFSVAGENDKFVYALKFWNKIPSDWVDKWTETMRDGIKKSFKY